MSELESTNSKGSETKSVWADVARKAAKQLGYASEAAVGGEAVTEIEREFLVFGLDSAAYAISVERVREIVRMKALTRIPRSAEWLLGVVALRGEVVEVIDLRLRLGLPASEPGPTHRIIVLHGEGDNVTGLLVDSVSEVYRIAEEKMRPSQGLDTSCVSEVCPRGDEFVSVLDVERALGVADV